MNQHHDGSHNLETVNPMSAVCMLTNGKLRMAFATATHKSELNRDSSNTPFIEWIVIHTISHTVDKQRGFLMF